MRKQRKDGIARWVKDIAKEGHSNRTAAIPAMVFHRDMITFQAGAFAQVFNYSGGPRYVLIAIPGPGTYGLTRFLMKELARRKVPHLIMPVRTRSTAGLIGHSIQVIDNGPWGFLLAPSALIKAEVEEPSAYEWDSYRRVIRAREYRESYYISGFDDQDAGYFLCELPQGSAPRNLAEAYECLKPEAVKLAEEMGRKVRRQGDIFAIPLRRDFEGAEAIKKGTRGYVLKTNHLATEMVQYGNAVYARGKLLHRPRMRNPDHAPLFLGRKWHLLVKNTVPVVVNRW